MSEKGNSGYEVIFVLLDGLVLLGYYFLKNYSY